MNELGELWELLVPLTVGAIGVVIGFGWGRIKAYAKSTEATWDDELIAQLEEMVARKSDKEKTDA